MHPELTESSALPVLTALHLSFVEELLAGWPGLSSYSRQVEAREETKAWSLLGKLGVEPSGGGKGSHPEAPRAEVHWVLPS